MPATRHWSFFVAPLLFGASTFFWTNGSYGIAGGTLLVLSTVFWVIALVHIFGWLRTALPLYSSTGVFFAVWAAISGACFGLADVFTTAFRISHSDYLRVAA